MHKSFAPLRMMAYVSLMLLPVISCTQTQSGLKLTVVARSEFKSPGAPAPTESSTIIYASGANRRTEHRSANSGPNRPVANLVTIERCDDHVVYVLNPETREYMELPLPAASGLSAEANSASAKVIFDVTTVDTGETKKVFGHTAHHYITTIKQTSSPELESPPSEIVENVWYLETADVMRCNGGSHRPRGIIGGGITSTGGGVGRQKAAPLPIPEYHYHGPDPTGLTLSSKRVTRTTQHYVYGETYETSSNLTSEIVEFKEERMDPALFQVPAGFTKVLKFTR